MNRGEIKAAAKEKISGKRWDFWKAYLIYFLIVFVLTKLFSLFFHGTVVSCIYGTGVNCVTNMDVYADIISAIVSLITAPLLFGFTSYVMSIIRGEKYDVNDVFKYKGKWGPIVLLTLLITVFTTLWSLLFIIPGIIAAVSYSVSQYIYIDNELTPMECIKKSKEMLKGYKWDYFVFQLSFIGWIILGAFTFGILYIWLIPYMTTAEILYYEELKKVQNQLTTEKI